MNGKPVENERKRAFEAVSLLEAEYPDAECSLESESPFQLLAAVMLSAQCTDARVNKVTPALFEKYPDAERLARADISDVENIIKSCGLYRTKARNLVYAARAVTERYGGVLPDSVEELVKLPGVGRKTANLICGDVYGKPAVVADTHFIRLCNRMGFVYTADPYVVECTMRELLPPERSNAFCHRTVIHGRAVCRAAGPECGGCCLSPICPKILKKPAK